MVVEEIDIGAALARVDLAPLRARFVEQDEALVLDRLLPDACVQDLLRALPRARPHVHRNYIPGHKKGGSVSRFTLDTVLPEIGRLYRDPALRRVLEGLAGESLLDCPPDDPHAYALYYYTEAGDHIGWHYDTSYYAGRRYTMLLGLVDRSSSRLECRLYTRVPGRAPEPLSVATAAGVFVFFNGDKLHHRVTPLGAGEERIALTMEFVTDTRMRGVRRFVSNMKDAIAYFGFRQVFRRS